MDGPHLAYRLPWRSLGKVTWHLGRCGPNEAREKQNTLEHFARCLADALEEFAMTDKTPPDEKAKFDPTALGVWQMEYEISPFGDKGYLDSLIAGYVHLNLILLDPNKFIPIVLGEERKMNGLMRVLCDGYSDHHPEWLAKHIRPVFDENGYIKPMTVDVVQTLQDHCKLLFRCLFSLPRCVTWYEIASYMELGYMQFE
ncbi:hypothetical protein Poli38472_000802 [Pythium oligandrum]|uniref:Uncharacterized protein n=1 Tax=Pythium oligandrum TaxID=41045 RepID=A0A8K1CCS9_PYTOL|nr:hypothetical protein Poli38472_000802 [Pythium oligandrum]|eukprot:TMW60760.1 hypothetical protein Poli38472_000802 [Pythium oligandrum]